VGLEEVELHFYLSLAPDGGEWLISRVGVCTYGERAPNFNKTGQQVSSV